MVKQIGHFIRDVQALCGQYLSIEAERTQDSNAFAALKRELDSEFAKYEANALAAFVTAEEQSEKRLKESVETVQKDIKKLENYLDLPVLRSIKGHVRCKTAHVPDMKNLERLYHDFLFDPTWCKVLNVMTLGQRKKKLAHDYMTHCEGGINYFNNQIASFRSNRDQERKRREDELNANLRAKREQLARDLAPHNSKLQLQNNRHNDKLEALLCNSAKVNELYLDLCATSDRWGLVKDAWNEYVPPVAFPDSLCLGYARIPADFSSQARQYVSQSKLAIFYSEKSGVLAPFCVPLKSSVFIEYPNEMRNEVVLGIQGMIMRLARSMPAKSVEVSIVDPIGRGGSLGRLIKLSQADPHNCPFINDPATTKAEISELLEKITKHIDTTMPLLADMGSEATIADYNAHNLKKIMYHVVIVEDFAENFDTSLLENLKLLTSDAAKRSGIILIVGANRKYTPKEKELLALYQELATNSVLIKEERGVLCCQYSSAKLRVKLSDISQVTDAYLTQVHNEYVKEITYNNQYESFFSLAAVPDYITKARKREKISLPFGIDEKTGEVASLVFEGMNFAGFLMGGSGSGKTTLIHAVIASLVRQYHPDEVELWLADFKESGFAPYEREMPPHIKYILMDSSPEMVCAFIDKMYDELVRRQAMLKTAQDRLEVPVQQYLPAIFVIIDEFAAISQTVSDRPIQQKRLADLMRQGRSAGFRFIFSSQGYTNGAGALNSIARDQIKMRIAMAHSDAGEIEGMLALPHVSPEMRERINNLPPYYVLHKEMNPSGFSLMRSLGLYFPGAQLKAWESRYRLFKRIRENMTPVDERDYDCTKPNQYVKKNPIVCSSTSLEAFSQKDFVVHAKKMRAANGGIVSKDDVILSFGKPRSLEENAFTFMTHSARENVLLLTNREEMVCTASVIISALLSAHKQYSKVQIWGHRTDPIFQQYKDSHFSKFTVLDDGFDICDAMKEMAKNIYQHKKDNALIVLLGIDKILQDIADELEDSPFMSYVDEDEETSAQAMNLPTMQSGVNPDEGIETCYLLNQEEEDQWNAVFEAIDVDDDDEDDDEDELDNKGAAVSVAKPRRVKKQNYRALFRDLVDYGARNGYHFLLCVDDYNRFKDMELKLKSFNHRIAFQTDTEDTSYAIFDSAVGARLAPNVCYYRGVGSANERFLISPYLHKGITWGGWIIDDDGRAKNVMYI